METEDPRSDEVDPAWSGDPTKLPPDGTVAGGPRSYVDTEAPAGIGDAPDSEARADEVDRALDRLRAGSAATFPAQAGAEGDPRYTAGAATLLPDLLAGHATAPVVQGTRIGNYTLIRELGRGGLGVVYEAIQDEPRRAVAIKLVRSGVLAGADEVALLRREGRVLARLQHPSIVSILETGTSADGQAFVAMDLAPGAPLDRWNAAAARRLEERVKVVISTCDAIESAHRRGVIHGDLKPGNIVVDDEGVPRVLDFGLARLERGVSAELSIKTLVGAYAGTVPWMSPEQAKGEDVDIRTDVHALGLILYRLIAGRHAYEVPRNPIAAAVVIAETRPRPIGVPEVGKDLEAIAGKALRKDREGRYASVTDLAEDLRRCLRGDPVSARAPSLVQSMRLLMRHHRNALTAAILVILVSWTATAVTLTSLAEASRSADESEKVLEYLSGTLRLSDPQIGGLTEPRVEDLLDAAALKVEELTVYPNMEAKIRSILGVAFTRLDRFDKARPHLERALRIRLDEQPGEHPEVATSLRDLGFLDHAQRRFEEAMEHKTAAFAMRRRLFGDGAHPDVVQSREEMADLLRDGFPARAAEVRALYQQNVDLLRQEPGRWSEKVWAQAVFGKHLVEFGEWNAGYLVLQRAMDDTRRVSDGRSFAQALTAMTFVLYLLGRYEDGVILLRDALARADSPLDPVSRSRLAVDLARLLAPDRDSWEEGVALATEARRVLSDRLGPGHLDALGAGEVLARALLCGGDVDGAGACVADLLRSCERYHGRQSNPMVNHLIVAAEVAVAKGDAVEMEALLSEAQAQAARGGDPALEKRVYEYLSTSRRGVGDLAGARRAAALELSHCKEAFGEASLEYLQAVGSVATVARAMRDPDASQRWLDMRLDLARRRGLDFGTTFAGTLVVRGRVAFERGDASRGEAFFKEALRTLEGCVSSSHRYYRSVVDELEAWRSEAPPDTTRVAWCSDSPAPTAPR